MGLLSRKPKPAARAAKATNATPKVKRGPIVRVAFRDLTQPVPDNGPAGRYVYSWPFMKPPKRGQRVIVPSDFGGGFAVVTGMGYVKDAHGEPIKAVKRLVTDGEVAAAHRKADADADAWLRMAQRAAGFTVAGRARLKPPEGYQPIPPADGDAPTPEAAREYAYIWSKVQKLAEERGAPDEQIKKFKSIRYRWSAVARKMAADA